MVREQQLDPEVEVLWEDFHAEVNVPSEQLRQWLLTRGSGEAAFGPDPDLNLPEPGRQILAVLRKRKVDLTPEDIEVMRDAVERIRSLTAAKPAGATPTTNGDTACSTWVTTCSSNADRPGSSPALPHRAGDTGTSGRATRLRGWRCSSRVSRLAYSARSAGSGTSGNRRRKASHSRTAAVCAAAARRSSSRSSAAG